jgi:XTP/dITP diphosphohydrolase
MKLVFASNNSHKVREISHILDNKINLLSLQDIDILDDIPENEPLIEGNAMFKARYVHSATGLNVFADDTGLEIEVLNGLPGVHSARFAGENKDSSANIVKVLAMMKGKGNRKARFRTVIALVFENNEYLFEGIVSGTIIDEKRGVEGFGYDPIFIPEGRELTFAQMTLNEKSKISHRAIAFEKLKEFLNKYNLSDNKEIT